MSKSNVYRTPLPKGNRVEIVLPCYFVLWKLKVAYYMYSFSETQ